MNIRCDKCGGKLEFSPENKGLKCASCSNIEKIEYKPVLNKKPFTGTNNNVIGDFVNSLKSVQCSTCGAKIILSNNEVQDKCMYCGNLTISEEKLKSLNYIDALLPFNISKEQALNNLKEKTKKNFFVDKTIFKNASVENIVGSYVNAYVFDLNTSNTYSGTFSYTRTRRDKKGRRYSETVYKSVSGTYEKFYPNMTIEANANIDQQQLNGILPFDYSSLVEFKEDFLNGYVLEYPKSSMQECFKTAEDIIRKDIKKCLLSKHGCTNIVSLDLKISYINPKYSYNLVPIYFIAKQHKKKNITALVNGQTGKVGKLPLNKWKILLTVLMFVLGIGAIVLLCYLL